MSNTKLQFQAVYEAALESIPTVISWNDDYADAYKKAIVPAVFAVNLPAGQMAKSYDPEDENYFIFIGTRFGTIAVVPVHHHTGMGGVVCRDTTNEVLRQLLPFRPVSAKDLTVIVGKDGNTNNNIGYAIERMANTFCKEN